MLKVYIANLSLKMPVYCMSVVIGERENECRNKIQTVLFFQIGKREVCV